MGTLVGQEAVLLPSAGRPVPNLFAFSYFWISRVAARVIHVRQGAGTIGPTWPTRTTALDRGDVRALMMKRGRGVLAYPRLPQGITTSWSLAPISVKLPPSFMLYQ